ncbi:MAG: hypothetical protein PHE55_11780 [Methylococcaceae bacterium]|nr:hypothetical protein [Methylococcaceae bacterium]
MRTRSFFPSIEAEQIAWLGNYASKLPVHGPACGIRDEEITETLADLQYYLWLLQYWHPAIQRDARDATVYKALMIGGDGNQAMPPPQPSTFPVPPTAPKPGIQKRLFSQITRLKAGAGYHDAIGQDLGVIASASGVDHPVPEFELAVELGATGSRVRIDFKKYGHDGVWIECRINGGDWAFLAIDTMKPYLDERPLASGNTHETREYRLRWWDKDEPHGEWTAVQKVVLGG